MGWKLSAIIIDTVEDTEKVLSCFNFSDFEYYQTEALETVMLPKANEIYIDTYNKKTIICVDVFPQEIIESRNPELENKLITLFPNSEICCLILHSGVNLWGYSLIKNGEKIRARAGWSDVGTTVESGDPIKEELELLSKSRINDSGKREYWFEENPGNPFQEDQVGENFVFKIMERYFTVEDIYDEHLFEADFKGYKFTLKSELQSESNHTMPTVVVKKPWWQFW